jgi:hypothetical protein
MSATMRRPDGTGGDQDSRAKDLEMSKRQALKGAAIGMRDVPGNEGVGEHVRTRSQSGFGPGEIAEQRFRTERRKPVSSAGPVLKERALSKFDPAV